ncbi:AI-2E family transporter [[Collinsella] massiliensis]|uniref:AI-2E family transporter n=1 Tax=[Collinsella] massiliensis TaxID=1232426 RepID=A0A1Y3XXB5_9ACTN|nr:AI-2E family transporter [[Collinsella] massiliensis]OUN88958.1 AI-2E family transporter [[Collinsella] massiliensis]
MVDRARTDAAEAKLPGAGVIALRVWTVVGAIIIGIALLYVLGVLAPVVEFLAVGSLIAFIASPIVNALERKRIPRPVGAFIGLAAVILISLCVIMVIVPIFVDQVIEVLSRLPDQLQALSTWATQVAHDIEAFSHSSWASGFDSMLQSVTNVASSYVTQLAGDLGRGLFPVLSGFASQLFIIFLGLVLAYWLALDYPKIHREIATIVGEGHEMSYRFMVAILSRSVGGYMRSMVITSFIDGLLAFIGLLIIGHPYAALMGVLTGLMHLIPVLGSWISAFAATLLALFYSPVLAFWTIIVCMVAQNVTDNVVSPKVMQSSVQIHPAMNLAALVVGSTLMGAIGMVVAIPLCAALKGLFVFYFEKSTGRALVSYDGAIFQGTPFRDEHGNPVPAFDALGDDTFVQESELIPKDVAPTGSAVPRPDLENPWSKLQFLHRNSEADAKGEQKPADTAPDDKTSRD